MTRVFRLALLGAALISSGCATITRGSTSDVQFISNPPGAMVKTSNGLSCTTPYSMIFDRRETFAAVFEYAGLQKQIFVDTEVASGGAAGVAGNVLAGGIIGVGIDVATGAGLNHVPNPVVATFNLSATPAVIPETPDEPESPEAPAPVAVTPEEPSETRDDGFNWGS
ncbi:MAG: translation initiation factor 2 [Pseudomonadota bacterium]